MGVYFRAVKMLFIALWLRFSVANARQRLQTENNDGE